MSNPSNGLTAAVQVARTPAPTMITLRGDLASKPLKDAVKAATGATMPDVRAITAKGKWSAAWMSPDELLLIGPDGGARDALEALEKALKDQHFLAVDVSSARAMFTLEGAGLRECLAKLTPGDLHPEAFGPGTLRRTRLGQVAAAFWMTGDSTAHVICFASVADYMGGLLANAAATPGAGHLGGR